MILLVVLPLFLLGCSTESTDNKIEEEPTKYPDVPTMGVTDLNNWGKF